VLRWTAPAGSNQAA